MKSLIIFVLVSYIYSTEYFVATTGDSLNIGTYSNPFLKVQQAVEIMQPGDICYIRQGVYHENIIIDDNDGNLGNPLLFTSYNDE